MVHHHNIVFLNLKLQVQYLYCADARSERQVANPDFKLLERHKINIKSREVRQKDIFAIAKPHLTLKRHIPKESCPNQSIIM